MAIDRIAIPQVSIKLCELVEQAAAEAIKERGTFALAVPGGSVLKMLSPLAGRKNLDWSKIHMWYVVRSWRGGFGTAPANRLSFPLTAHGYRLGENLTLPRPRRTTRPWRTTTPSRPRSKPRRGGTSNELSLPTCADSPCPEPPHAPLAALPPIQNSFLNAVSAKPDQARRPRRPPALRSCLGPRPPPTPRH